MAWATPVVDWAADDVIATTDLNRIEENTRVGGLRLGNGCESIAAAVNLDITPTASVFALTGTTAIVYIKTTGRVAGARIHLIFSGNTTVTNAGGAAPAGYANITIHTGGNISAVAYQCIEFVYNGSTWHPVGNWS